MTPETKFNLWIAQKLFFDAHVQRIETSTGSGVPDMNICWYGIEFWAESKVETPGGNILLRPFQWAWMKKRQNAGGKVILLAERNQDRPAQVSMWAVANINVAVHGAHLKVITTPLATIIRNQAGIDRLRGVLQTI
jgi:hypothetical protein